MKKTYGALTIAWAMLAWAGCADNDQVKDKGGAIDVPADSPFAAEREPDSEKTFDTLSAGVEIVEDELGIPHVYSPTLKGALFANGYLHARDRLFNMDALRHLGLGTVSEYVGPVGMGFDPNFRATFMTASGENVADAIVAQMPAEDLDLMQAYADGVNAYLTELRAGEHQLPQNYGTELMAGVTPDDIPDWQPRDTLAVARVLEWQLTNGSAGADLDFANLVQAYPADVFADMVRHAPADKTVVLDDWFSDGLPNAQSASQGVDLLDLDPSRAEHRAAFEQAKRLYRGIDFRPHQNALPAFLGGGGEREGIGSNNWVIGGEHTESGFPIVANDPHLGFVQPATFYHVHLNTRLYGGDVPGSVNIQGILVGGVPGVLIGHTAEVAWGATVVGWDVTDVYVETLNDAGDAVIFNGDEVPIVSYEQEFKVRSGSETQTLTEVIEYVPHHGPILKGSKADGKALSVKWTGRLVDSEISAIIGMQQSRSVDDWYDALKGFATLAQSFNAADNTGARSYFPHAKIPKRKSYTGDCAPWKPVDGTGACEWEGFYPSEQVPQMRDNEKGWLVTANNDIVGTLVDNDPTNDPQYLHTARSVGYRAGRLHQLIEEKIDAGEKISVDDVVAMQADNVSLESLIVIKHLLAAADADPDKVSELGLTTALDRLRDWKGSTPSGVDADYRTDGGPDQAEIDASIACSIFHAFYPRFMNKVLGDEAAQYGAGLGTSAKTRAIIFLLETPDDAVTGDALFDDVTTADVVETRDQLLLEALAEGLAFLASSDAFDSDDMSQWRWGELHGMRIQDLFGQFADAPFITRGPYPRGGGNFVVDASGHGSSGTGFIYGSGPQMRFVAELRPEGVRAWNGLPGGQSDDVGDPHYEDLLQLWLRNEPFQHYFSEADVVSHMDRYTVFRPAK